MAIQDRSFKTNDSLFYPDSRAFFDKLTGPYIPHSGLHLAYPDSITRIRMRFGQVGRYMWHCHVLEHEDNEMMRPYQVRPSGS